MIRAAAALCRAWLVIDFFGDTRRSGQPGSSLTSTIFTQSFVALVFAALCFDDSIGLGAFAAANLSLSTLLLGVGLGTSSVDLDRIAADRVLVGTAPVPRALLPLARAAHGAFALCLVTVGMALPPAILAAFVADRPLVAPGYLLAAVLLAGCAAGSFGLLVRIVERLGGTVRSALVAGTTKALVLGGGLVAFALALPHLDEDAAALPFGRVLVEAWPPYWAARWLADPVAAAGSGIAVLALGAALLGLSLWLGEGGEVRGGARIGARRRGPLDRIEGWLCGPDRALLGVTAWTAAMLFRSPGFRNRALPLFGIPFAFVFLAFGEQGLRERTALLGVTLQLPAIYLPFLVAFLPHADQAGVAWLFETAPRHARTLGREAAVLAIAVRILLPVQLVAAATIAALGLGGWIALGLPAASFALAVAVLCWSARGLEHVPFSAEADEAGALEFGGLVGVALVLAALGIGAGLAARTPAGALVGLAAAAATFAHLRRAAARVARQEAAL